MREVFKKYHGTLIGLTFIIAWMIIFYFFQVYGLWGEPRDAGPTGFCEYFDPNLIVGEPINAWSNFFYVGAGMIVLIYYDLLRMGKAKRKDTYIDKDENLHYLVTFGILVVWIGIASFLMHATWSGTEWISTGFLDVLSMNMFLSGVFVISWAILFDLKKTHFYVILIIVSVLDFILMKTRAVRIRLGDGLTLDLFKFLVILVFFSEIVMSFGIYSKWFKKAGARQIKRNSAFVIGILGLFLFAYFVWHFGVRDAPTCDPYSWWQWHSVWHFITACCTVLIAMYIRTEKELT